jgi:hypothetical protein
MPAVIWHDARVYRQTLTNPLLQELLDEVQQKTGREWVIHERRYTEHRWFRKPQERVLYELLVDTGSGMEWQVINFDVGTDWTINHMVEAHHIVNYLYGVLAGLQENR